MYFVIMFFGKQSDNESIAHWPLANAGSKQVTAGYVALANYWLNWTSSRATKVCGTSLAE